MIGMFHDGGTSSYFVSNVAAGSERSGFSGPGFACDAASASAAQNSPSKMFSGNTAHSSLVGFLFDFYAVQKNAVPCIAIAKFTAWKIWLYGVYGELLSGAEVVLSETSVSDARVGVRISLGGTNRISRRISMQRMLLVGRSSNSNCRRKSPSLWTCAHYMAYCSHLDPQVMPII